MVATGSLKAIDINNLHHRIFCHCRFGISGDQLNDVELSETILA